MAGELTEKKTLPVMDTVELDVTRADGGKLSVVAKYVGGDEPEVLHADKYPEGFYGKRNPRGNIKNEVSEALEGPETDVDPKAWEKAWSRMASEMVANEDEADVELVKKNVRQLAEGTESVYVTMGGDTRKWEITINWNDKTGKVVLNHNEMASGGVMALKSQMFKEFADSPEIQKEDWDSLKSYWIEQQEERAVENVTEKDRAVEDFINALIGRIKPTDEPSNMDTSKEAVWYDIDNDHGLTVNGHSDDSNGVVWVRGDLVSEVLTGMDNSPDIGSLGGELGDRGHTLRTSEKLQPDGPGSGRRYWFFDPDTLNITEMDLHEEESSEASEAPGGTTA